MSLLLVASLLHQEPEPTEKDWEFYASVYAYRLREDRDYLQPTFTADRGLLHLEVRYNYEDQDTGSAWIGANLGIGEEVRFDATPMLGAVLGQTAGIAPGLKATLTWWKLELYAEAEYVFHFHDHHDNFFYMWSEATISPWEWLQVGLVTQRTRVYDNDRDIQRGLLARLKLGHVDITAAYFNPDEHPVYMLGIGVGF
ncbi:MAG TPA: hypothetical protein VE981_15700 [Planctomycetota bacterium]|nr:hypothetical protein [Planctomycetota bacterium]